MSAPTHAYVIHRDNAAVATFSADRVARERRDGDVVERRSVDPLAVAKAAIADMDPLARAFLRDRKEGDDAEVFVRRVVDGEGRLAGVSVVSGPEVGAAPKGHVATTSSRSPRAVVEAALEALGPVERLCVEWHRDGEGSEHAMVGSRFDDHAGRAMEVVRDLYGQATTFVSVAPVGRPRDRRTEPLAYVAHALRRSHPDVTAAARLAATANALSARGTELASRLAREDLDLPSRRAISDLQERMDALLEAIADVEPRKAAEGEYVEADDGFSPSP